MKITTGFILCGGTGRRVRGYINSKQKCMHRVFGIPVITHLLDQLNINGFRNIYFLCHYNHREISDFFGKKFKNLNLNYVIEKKKLGTGGAIINGFKRTKINHAYIFNGDTIYNFNNKNYNFIKLKKNTVFFKKKDSLHKNSSGNIVFTKNTTKFNEKIGKSKFINTGIYFFNKSILDLKLNKKCSLEKDILGKNIFLQNFNFKKIKINFYDIGDKKRIRKIHKIKNLFGQKNKTKAIFLDRDGTIIDDKVKYLYKIKDVKFIYKTLRLIKKNKNFYKIFIVTNQSGIGRKFYSLKDFYNVTDFIIKKLSMKKIYINGVHFCPHLPSDNCKCRKPRTKMLNDIKYSFNIDLRKSIMYGNEDKDELFAKFKLKKFYRI